MIRTLTIGDISTEDLGIYVIEGNPGTPTPCIIAESIPYRDGSYDFSRADGSLHYNDRTMQYSFAVKGMTAEETQDRISEVLTWLNSGGEICDEYISGWLYDNARCTSADVEYLSEDRRVAKITAAFTASPWLISEHGYDPTREPPSAAVTKVSKTGQSVSADGKTAVLTYPLSGFSEAVMVRLRAITSCTISAEAVDGNLTAIGTAGGYFYAVADKACSAINVTYTSESVDISTIISSMPSAFVTDVYPERYGRARRL